PQQCSRQRGDVMDDPSQQVSAAKRGQASRGERLESLVRARSQGRQRPEGGVMADQPLLVAKQATRQAKELNGDDGDGERGLRRALRSPGDEPRRGGDESDPGTERSRAEQG